MLAYHSNYNNYTVYWTVCCRFDTCYTYSGSLCLRKILVENKMGNS